MEGIQSTNNELSHAVLLISMVTKMMLGIGILLFYFYELKGIAVGQPPSPSHLGWLSLPKPIAYDYKAPVYIGLSMINILQYRFDINMTNK